MCPKQVSSRFKSRSLRFVNEQFENAEMVCLGAFRVETRALPACAVANLDLEPGGSSGGAGIGSGFPLKPVVRQHGHAHPLRNHCPRDMH